MKILYLLITLCTTLGVYTSLVCAQYNYIGHYTEEECKRSISSSAPTSTYRGYSCSGDLSCTTNLTYRSQSGYSTLSDIASLFGVDSNTISLTNPEYRTGIVEGNKLVYVPVTCGCPNGWLTYLKSVSYTVKNDDLTFYQITNNTFQGLTTCQVLRDAYPNGITRGYTINVPLRCACPTASQKKNGIKSLITYVVGTGDTVSSVSTQLKVDSKSIYEANNLQEGSTIYPFTTLLIPVPSTSESSSPLPPSPSASQPPEAKAKAGGLSTGAIAGIAAGGSAVLLAIGGGVAYRFNLCGSMFNCFNRNVINYFSREDKKEDDKNSPRSHDEPNKAKK